MSEATNEQFKQVMGTCREIFVKKLHDYDAAWRVLRVASVTDQIFIKACRIRSIQESGVALINEGIEGEFMGIVNYGIIGLIQLDRGASLTEDMNEEEAVAVYDKWSGETFDLMVRKNHDYNEAWRGMRISSYVDLILMKVNRTKKIERLGGATLVSEGIDANYMDMINYSVFALIKIREGATKEGM